jgi:hypothetical protein
LSSPFLVSALLAGINDGWPDFGTDRARFERVDGSAFQDVEETYNNPDYQGGSAELPTPAGGFFGPVADSTPVGRFALPQRRTGHRRGDRGAPFDHV